MYDFRHWRGSEISPKVGIMEIKTGDWDARRLDAGLREELLIVLGRELDSEYRDVLEEPLPEHLVEQIRALDKADA